jgi:hypothetical protein
MNVHQALSSTESFMRQHHDLHAELKQILWKVSQFRLKMNDLVGPFWEQTPAIGQMQVKLLQNRLSEIKKYLTYIQRKVVALSPPRKRINAVGGSHAFTTFHGKRGSILDAITRLKNHISSIENGLNKLEEVYNKREQFQTKVETLSNVNEFNIDEPLYEQVNDVVGLFVVFLIAVIEKLRKK